jgi:FkbM family methyltransferase
MSRTVNSTGKPRPAFGVRVLRVLVWCFTAMIPIALLFLLSPHSERAWTASFHLVAFVRTLIELPGFAGHRNARCSLLDAWSQTIPSDRILAERKLLAQFRLLRADGGFNLIETPSGRFWIPRRDLSVLAEMIAEENREVYGSGSRGIRPGDVVLDCGASVGVYTRYALNHGAKLVVAIEPAPEALECLRRNLDQAVSAGRVIIYPKGVWNKDEVLEITTNDSLASTASSVAINRGAKGPKIQLTTIDKLVDELRLDRTDFIKMDIEGAEPQALEGALRTVARFHPRMSIALEHRPSDPDDIPRLVKRLWPDYRTECGPCVNVNGNLQPDVLFSY